MKPFRKPACLLSSSKKRQLLKYILCSKVENFFKFPFLSRVNFFLLINYKMIVCVHKTLYYSEPVYILCYCLYWRTDSTLTSTAVYCTVRYSTTLSPMQTFSEWPQSGLADAYLSRNDDIPFAQVFWLIDRQFVFLPCLF